MKVDVSVKKNLKKKKKKTECKRLRLSMDHCPFLKTQTDLNGLKNH